VGFSFNPPVAAEISPGQTSDVVLISTSATNFAPGNFSVIDGGVTTVSAFEPTSSTAVPEPTSFLMLSTGLLALMGVRRVLSH
jgi:hypothetical protein